MTYVVYGERRALSRRHAAPLEGSAHRVETERENTARVKPMLAAGG